MFANISRTAGKLLAILLKLEIPIPDPKKWRLLDITIPMGDDMLMRPKKALLWNSPRCLSHYNRVFVAPFDLLVWLRNQQEMKKARQRHISRMPGSQTAELNVINCGTLRDICNVINCGKFHFDQFGGFWITDYQSWEFPTEMHYGFTTMLSATELKRDFTSPNYWKASNHGISFAFVGAVSANT